MCSCPMTFSCSNFYNCPQNAVNVTGNISYSFEKSNHLFFSHHFSETQSEGNIFVEVVDRSE